MKRVEIGKEDVRVVYKIGQLPFVPGPASGASLQDCLWGVFSFFGVADAVNGNSDRLYVKRISIDRVESMRTLTGRRSRTGARLSPGLFLLVNESASPFEDNSDRHRI